MGSRDEKVWEPLLYRQRRVSEMQAHHCMAPLALVQCECHTDKHVRN